MIFIAFISNIGDQNVLINDWYAYACLHVLSKQLTEVYCYNLVIAPVFPCTHRIFMLFTPRPGLPYSQVITKISYS